MITIIDKGRKLTRAGFKAIAEQTYGHLAKAVVDVKEEILVLGVELHSDGETVLLEQGSRQEDVWGINLYPDKSQGEWIEFDSVINLKPSFGNDSRGVKSPEVRKKIEEIVSLLIEE